MSIKDDFYKLIRADEYKAESDKESSIQESAANNAEHIALDLAAQRYPVEKMNYKTKVTKAVIAECTSRLYMDSLLIENADQYKEALMPVARQQVIEALKEYADIDSMKAAMSHASPYVKAMFTLAEEVNERHDDIIAEKDDMVLSKIDCYRVMNKDTNTILGYIEAEDNDEAKKKFEDGDFVKMDDCECKSDDDDDKDEDKKDDDEKEDEKKDEEKSDKDESEELHESACDATCGTADCCAKSKELREKVKNIKPFPKNVILDKDDLKLIHDWEQVQGKDVYAEELQDRVAKVYAEEEDAAKAQKEQIQAIVDKLSEIPGETVAEAVSGSFNTLNHEPTSIFNAIFMNKSKQVINESGEGSNIESGSEDIMCETICTYTLLETIHSLGIHRYTDEEKQRLMYRFVVAQ